MRNAEIEAWALRVVDAIAGGQLPEDARVECKAGWVDAAAAARRIAALANAARGDVCLLLIGVDERRGVVPFAAVDPAEWFAQVRGQFDGVTPAMCELQAFSGGQPFYAVLIETDRGPYVVRNPAFGTAGHKIRFEVPWRDGSETRSASRDELLRILVPHQVTPDAELRWARCSFLASRGGRPPVWEAAMGLYITPRGDAPLTLPRHATALRWQLQVAGEDLVKPDDLVFDSLGGEPMRASSSQAVLLTSGLLVVRGIHRCGPQEPRVPLGLIKNAGGAVRVAIAILPVGMTDPIRAEATLQTLDEHHPDTVAWGWDAPEYSPTF